MDVVPTPIRIEGAFEDPQAVRALVAANGPYPSIASYLPQTATKGRPDDSGGSAPLPWFRGNWAVNGHCSVEGAEVILQNGRFVEAASRLFGTPHVRPTTVVVNVNAPMAAGAIHIDIPSFRGANRDRYPLRLLQAMGTSGLFEGFRIVEAGAITWFYEGRGGAYDYWPEGLDAPMHSEQPPFDNRALVADNDRMYHRIGWVGDPLAAAPAISAAAEIEHLDSGDWALTEAGETKCMYSAEQIRVSILWKAQVLTDTGGEDRRGSLTEDHVVEIITADLRNRGILATPPTSPLADESWIDLVHATYYPPISACA